MTTERRPRIPGDLADKIDQLRDGHPFEFYVRMVLEDHVHHRLGDPNVEDEMGERRHSYEDIHGTGLDIYNSLNLVVAAEGYDAVAVLLNEPELRALRDVCTELLGELSS